MPISKAKAALYPANWKDLSKAIRERSGGFCECTGECGATHLGGRCQARNGDAIPGKRGKVVLTTAHLDHDPTGDDPALLKAMCQGCHLRLDRDQHRASSADTRARKADAASGQRRLF